MLVNWPNSQWCVDNKGSGCSLPKYSHYKWFNLPGLQWLAQTFIFFSEKISLPHGAKFRRNSRLKSPLKSPPKFSLKPHKSPLKHHSTMRSKVSKLEPQPPLCSFFTGFFFCGALIFKSGSNRECWGSCEGQIWGAVLMRGGPYKGRSVRQKVPLHKLSSVLCIGLQDWINIYFCFMYTEKTIFPFLFTVNGIWSWWQCLNQ